MTAYLDNSLRRLLRLALALVALAIMPAIPAHADPGDVDAAARGVVRIIIMSDDGNDLAPVSHGTGFAVAPDRIVTNAHVVEDVRGDPSLAIAIVPSDGGEPVYGKILAYSPRNDLALIAPMQPISLPPLTISGNVDPTSGQVTAVGYPQNVDRAQGLDTKDLFRAQPPVKSQGFLSGSRPSREFDTLLHTAPIARGNSGGPLLDNCGRVVGVNSFGAESGGADSEFYFAVSTRELLPFLHANNITPQVNGLPCKSMADLDAEEQARSERAQLAAIQKSQAEASEKARAEQQARRQAELEVISERENGMALALILLGVAAAVGYAAWQARTAEDDRKFKVAGAIAGVALLAAGASWLTRPGFTAIDERAAAALAQPSASPSPSATPSKPGESKLVCVINVERSRVTTAETDDIPFDWTADGCVNGRTQYGRADGKWTRLFVPSSEAVVSVNSFDPDTDEYRVDRYLLGNDAMAATRKARGEYEAPACGAGDAAARDLGQQQAGVIASLPSQPNERLVYDCHPAK